MLVKKTMEELERKSIPGAWHAGKHPVILILDDVRSMHKVGCVFRTADSFAVSAIYLCGYTPVPPHRDIHKTALGATDTVAWTHFPDAMEAVKAARELGYKICCIEQVHNSIPLNQLGWTGEPMALVFGNEVTGVNEEVLK